MALITQSQWETVIGAARVVDLCDDDASGTADAAVVSAVLDQASDFVQEYAVAAGAALTTPTAAMVRRIAIVAAYYAASRRPQYRDAQGNPPYAVEYMACVKELEAWASRVRALSTDDVSTAPKPQGDDQRGW